MNDRAPTPPELTPQEKGLTELARARERIEQLCREAAVNRVPAELAPIAFDADHFEQVDDKGSPCLSYGVYNQSAAPVFVAMQGGVAQARAGALEVPARRLVVFPFAVSGHVTLGVDAKEVEEGKRPVIFRARFHTVQPFFIGAL